MKKYTLALLMVVLTAIPAAFAKPTTLFSFASDDNHSYPTFGNGSSGKIIVNSKVVVDLMVDVNGDYAGGLVTYNSEFTFYGEIRDYTLIPCGSNWLHIWKVKGEFNFTHFNGLFFYPLLKVEFSEAVLTSLSPNRDTLGETMTLQDSDSVDPSLLMTTDTILKAIDVTDAHLAYHEDFAFTFTNIKNASSSNPYDLVKISGGTIAEKWTSEGSFSAAGN